MPDAKQHDPQTKGDSSIPSAAYLEGVKALTPSQKGAAAEAAITAAVIQLGLTVLRPLCEGRRYDLIIDLEPALLRVNASSRGARVACLRLGFRPHAAHHAATSEPATRPRRSTPLAPTPLISAGAISSPCLGSQDAAVSTFAWSRPGTTRPRASRGLTTTNWSQPWNDCAPIRHGARAQGSYTFATRSRGYSSAGRALPWHGRGRRFEPD